MYDGMIEGQSTLGRVDTSMSMEVACEPARQIGRTSEYAFNFLLVVHKSSSDLCV